MYRVQSFLSNRCPLYAGKNTVNGSWNLGIPPTPHLLEKCFISFFISFENSWRWAWSVLLDSGSCASQLCRKEWLFMVVLKSYWGFPGGSESKDSSCNVGDLALIPKLGRSLEEGMATHSSILAWRIQWVEEPGRLQSMGSQRVGHNWVTHTNSNLIRVRIEVAPQIQGIFFLSILEVFSRQPVSLYPQARWSRNWWESYSCLKLVSISVPVNMFFH